MDLFPTFSEITHASVPEGLQFDGVDLRKLLEDPEATELPERPFYYYARNGKCEAVRMGKWKLHVNKTNGWKSKEEFPVSLYNLDEDISEKVNLANENPEVVEKLKNLITEFDNSID